VEIFSDVGRKRESEISSGGCLLNEGKAGGATKDEKKCKAVGAMSGTGSQWTAAPQGLGSGTCRWWTQVLGMEQEPHIL
jgi:hypothetical protein